MKRTILSLKFFRLHHKFPAKNLHENVLKFNNLQHFSFWPARFWCDKLTSVDDAIYVRFTRVKSRLRSPVRRIPAVSRSFEIDSLDALSFFTRKCILHVVLITVEQRNYCGMFRKHEIKCSRMLSFSFGSDAGVRFWTGDISLVASFLAFASTRRAPCTVKLLEKFMARNILWKLWCKIW